MRRMTTRNNVKQFMNIATATTTYDAVIDDFIPRVSELIHQELDYIPERQSPTAEYHSGNGTNRLVLKNMPVYSITNIWLDSDGYFGQGTNSPFATADLLTSGSDYALMLDSQDVDGTAISKSGIVLRTGSGNSAGSAVSSYGLHTGQLFTQGASGPAWPRGHGNIKVSYVCGYVQLPAALTHAATVAVSEWVQRVRQAASGGEAVAGPISSERLGDYSVSYAVIAETAAELLEGGGLSPTVRAMLSKFRRIRIVA